MKYTCLNCYKKKDIDKIRNRIVCNRCFKKELKRCKKLAEKEDLNPSLEYDKDYLDAVNKMKIFIIIMISISGLMIILTLALLW